MNLSGSYFAIPDVLQIIDRWLKPCRHRQTIVLQGKDIEVNWTDRADKALRLRQQPVILEMQLYFSCVVKKRVIFHEHTELDTIAVNEKLRLGYRAIQSAVCDPETFARDYPGARELESKAAARMQPSRLDIDYRKGQWLGEMGIGGK